MMLTQEEIYLLKGIDKTLSDILIRCGVFETVTVKQEAPFGMTMYGGNISGISIIIPTYEQMGLGAKFVTELLQSIARQKITVPYEIVICDSSRDTAILKVVEASSLNIRYETSHATNACDNINAAISMAKYDKVKLMCQDDLFASNNAIDLFSKALDKHSWVIANSVTLNDRSQQIRKHVARYTHNFYRKNLVGMPSVIGWRKCDLRLNPNLTTCIDMYFYHQLYELYGEPGYITDHCIGQRYHNASLSRQLTNTHDKDVAWLIENKMILQ